MRSLECLEIKFRSRKSEKILLFLKSFISITKTPKKSENGHLTFTKITIILVFKLSSTKHL